MSNHRAATPRRRRRSGRTRAMLALSAVAVLASGMSVQGTFAFWTDSATVNAGGFTSGTLDITVNGQLSGQGGTTAIANLALANITPGESVAASFPIANVGTTPLTYNLTGTGSGDLAVANGLQYLVVFGTTATNSGTSTAGNRTGACGSTTATDANTTLLNATAATLASNRALAPGASENVCVIARLNFQAPNALQNKAGNAQLLFDAKQVGA